MGEVSRNLERGQCVCCRSHLADVFKVHGHPGADNRLDLTQTPVFPPRVAHQHARLKHPAIRTSSFPVHQHCPTRQTSPALIASRICHDLISPIGAIGNGVELLTMESGSAVRPELALISASVANANARIRLFRIAFGAATGDQRIARNEVLSILTDLGHAGRITYAWTSHGDLSRREVRLVFLLVLCLETVLPYGGRVEVAQSETFGSSRPRRSGQSSTRLCGRC
jgi:hypothetical protein